MSIRSLRNRALIASGLLLGMSAALSPAAFAQSADLETSATNNAVTTFSISNTGAASYDFDYDAAVSDTKIGEALVKSNDADGFKVKAQSANAGLLLDGGTDKIAYSIKVGDSTPVVMTATLADVLTASFETACANDVGCVKAIQIWLFRS